MGAVVTNCVPVVLGACGCAQRTIILWVVCRRSDRASSLVNAAIGVALQTGAQVYSTAKDVFHTLQAQGQVRQTTIFLFLFLFCLVVVTV